MCVRFVKRASRSAAISLAVALTAFFSSVANAQNAATPLTSVSPAATPVDTSLPNGMRLIVQDEPSSRLVAVDVFIKTGAQEDERENGIGNFVAATLLSGTQSEPTEVMQQQIGSLGGNINALWEPDFTQIQALVLAPRYDDLAYLLSDIVQNADFPESVVEAARADLLAREQSESDDLFSLAYDNLKQILYSGTPYSASSLGSPTAIDHIAQSDLEAYFQKYFRPQNVVISIVGNVDPQHAISTFESDLSQFGQNEQGPPDLRNLGDSLSNHAVKHFRGDLRVGIIMAGFRGPEAGSPDYAAMQVANALLGGMKTSLLFTNLRDAKSYGYDVESLYTPQAQAGDVTAYIITSPIDQGGVEPAAQLFPDVKQALLAQFQTMQNQAPSNEALARAKNFLIGSYLVEHERILDRAYYLGYSEIELKPLGGYLFDKNYAQYINAVTAADVQRVSRTYFSEQPFISMLLPGSPDAGVIKD